MAKFRKKPVVIEAVQLLWQAWSKVCEHAGVGKLEDGKPTGCCIGPDGQPLPDGETSDEIGLLIPTLEGRMVARQGDWIIRGVQGELYPCKDEIFRQTYEPVEETSGDAGEPDVFAQTYELAVEEDQETPSIERFDTAKLMEALSLHVEPCEELWSLKNGHLCQHLDWTVEEAIAFVAGQMLDKDVRLAVIASDVTVVMANRLTELEARIDLALTKLGLAPEEVATAIEAV